MHGIADQVPLDCMKLASCQMKNSRGGQVEPGGPRWSQVEPDQPGGQGTVVNVGVTGPPALQW